MRTLCHSLPTLLRVLRRPDPDAPLVHGSLHPAYFRDVTEAMLLPSCSHLPALRCSSLVMAMSDSLVVPPAAFCTLSEPILESPRLHHHVCLTHATASVRLAVCLTLSHTSPSCPVLPSDFDRPRCVQRQDLLGPRVRGPLNVVRTSFRRFTLTCTLLSLELFLRCEACANVCLCIQTLRATLTGSLEHLQVPLRAPSDSVTYSTLAAESGRSEKLHR